MPGDEKIERFIGRYRRAAHQIGELGGDRERNVYVKALYSALLDGLARVVYWWNEQSNQLWCRQRGVSGFCVHRHLLSLNHHEDGRDVLERVFFGEVDWEGATVRDLLLETGPEPLSSEQRSAFARLLMSLEARRPAIVQRLRRGRDTIADGLDNDPLILAAMVEHGITMRPSEMAERRYSLEDRVLLILQSLVDNPDIGQRVINARWAIRRLRQGDGTLVLGDRPLVRRGRFDESRMLWYLPLTPTVAFIAVDRQADLHTIMRITGARFAKVCNTDAAREAERFVFAADPVHQRWLGKVLRKKASSSVAGQGKPT